MIPAEEFRKFASECLAKAKFSRSRDSKAAWDHMAARWARCAEISEQQAAAAKLGRTTRQHARIRNGRAAAAWMCGGGWVEIGDLVGLDPGLLGTWPQWAIDHHARDLMQC